MSNVPNSCLRRLNVLMVDSNKGDQRLMSEALATVGGCEFVGLTSRDEALSYMRQGGSPDLVALTLDSETAVLELLKVLKSHNEWQHIPVAVFPGGSGPNEVNVVRSLGACYFQKPVDFEGHVRLAAELVALTHLPANCEAPRATRSILQ